MKNLKRWNHYLPVCYQNGFTNSRGKVWIKFFDKSRAEERNPLSVGATRSLYIVKRSGIEHDDVEDFFEKVVETPFAPLAKRIKEEQNRFANVTEEELTALYTFIAAQLVRTVAHKRCIEEQVGGTVDTNTFVRTFAKQALGIMETWNVSSPELQFHTSLPHIGDQFITGDNPVVAIKMNDNTLWVPRSDPRLAITDITQFLNSPNHYFWISLSPYVCASITGHGRRPPQLPPRTVDPQFVRFLNDRICDQSRIFVLARDKSSLA